MRDLDDYDDDDYWSHSDHDHTEYPTVRNGPRRTVIDQLNEKDPYIYLAGPDKDEYKDFMGSQNNVAQIQMLDGTVLPSHREKNRLGLHLAFSVAGGSVAKRVAISVMIAGADIKKLHHVHIEFFPGLGEVKELAYEEHVDEANEATNLLLIQWKTSGGHSCGLTIPTDEYDAETQDAIRFLRSFILHESCDERVIKLIVPSTSTIRKELDRVISTPSHNVPWRAYLDNNLQPMCHFQKMVPRKSIEKSYGRLIRFPAQNSFSTATEAHVQLAYGMTLEFRRAPEQNLRSSWPRTIKQAEYLQGQLRALDTLFSTRACEETKLWVPVILNQATELLPISDPVVGIGLSKMQSIVNMRKVISCFPWTNEQRTALQMARSLRGRVGIVEGVPGSGKTHVLAGIALFYALCGGSVFLFAPSASQARVLTTTLVKLLELADINTLAVCEICSGETRQVHNPSRSSDVAFVVTTPNAICDGSLSSKFPGHKSGLFVLHDDSDSSLETEILATLVGYSNKVVHALILTGDVKEWPLDVVTQSNMVRCIKDDQMLQDSSRSYGYMFSRFFQQRDNEPVKVRETPRPVKPKVLKPGDKPPPPKESLEFFGGLNEFADQIGLSLLSRLRRQGMPTSALRTQYRMKPAIVDFANVRTYKHGIQTAEAALKYSQDPKFENLLREWLKLEEDDERDMSVIYLEASRGPSFCNKDSNSKSKHNCRNVEVVLNLISRNRESQAVPANEITIITPYADQVRLYQQMYKELQESSKANPFGADELPAVYTVDQMRGCESRIVILDLTVTCGDAMHEIGIVGNEIRASIAATRAKDHFIIVGSTEFVRHYPLFWHWLMVQGDHPSTQIPYLVEYAQELVSKELVFKPDVPRGTSVVFVRSFKPKQGDCDHLWGRWMHRTADYDRND